MTLQKQEQAGQVEQYRPSGHHEQVEGVVVRDSDITLPFLQIGQPTSGGDVQAGRFYRKDTGQTFDTIDVVPLAIQPTRTKFPPGKFSRDAKPECWSDDDVTGSQRPRFEDGQPVQARYVGRSCAGCEHAVRFSGGDNREQGKCLPAYIVGLLDIDTFETVMLRLQSTNTKMVRVLGALPHVRKAVLRLSLRAVENDSGKWYALSASAQRLIKDDERVVVEGAYDMLRGRMRDVEEEPAAAGADESQPDPVANGQAAMDEAAASMERVEQSPQAEQAQMVDMPKPGQTLPF